MRNIQVKCLNPEAMPDIEKMMVLAARLTQRGEKLKTMDDVVALYNKPWTPELFETLRDLPHDTIKRFGCLNFAIVGASRRFLAQITRHQVGVTFMSGSLQYSDYSNQANFVIPYSIIEKDAETFTLTDSHTTFADAYCGVCEQSMKEYAAHADFFDNDTAGYIAPQGLRNVLLMSANPLALIHMCQQRTCNRNTLETQYVMLLVAEILTNLSPMFLLTLPDCITGKGCQEGKMACPRPLSVYGCGPSRILHTKFKYLY